MCSSDLYDLTYLWNLKQQQQQIQTHRKRDQICGYQRWREEELEESSQKVQTSSCKINKYYGYNVQYDDYS